MIKILALIAKTKVWMALLYNQLKIKSIKTHAKMNMKTH